MVFGYQKLNFLGTSYSKHRFFRGFPHFSNGYTQNVNAFSRKIKKQKISLTVSKKSYVSLFWPISLQFPLHLKPILAIFDFLTDLMEKSSCGPQVIFQ